MTMLQKNLSSKPETETLSTPAPSLKDSFFRAFSRKIKSYKLGDLLVASGVISPEQLNTALFEQSQNGGQLGSILIQQKAVSAVQLYNTLAEQWCIKAATAGIAVLVQVGIPTPAQADELEGSTQAVELTLAAATTHHEAIRHYPELFGTHETRSNDIAPFKKWSALINLFEGKLNSSAPDSEGVMQWRAEISRLKGLSRRKQIEGVNNFLNQIPYVDDRQEYGEAGYWHATPERFLDSGGDCKDYALAKYASLHALGFPVDELRVAIVQDKIKNLAHAILIVYSDDGSFVLDNQDKRVENIDTVNRYQPIFSINSTSWWLHRA